MLSLSICSLKGGVGKTSVTLGLASAALHQEVPTLVVDADPQGDATLGLLGTPPAGGDLAAVIAAATPEALDEAIRPVPWADGPRQGLDVLPGSHRSARFDSPRPNDRAVGRMREALEHSADRYELAIIDCPPSLNGLTQMALAASDLAVVVAEPGLFAVSATDRALKLIAELREQDLAPSLRPGGIVVNRFRPRSVEHRFRLDELRGLFGDFVLEPVLEERVGMQQALGASIPLHRYEGPSGQDSARWFDDLLRTLRNR